TRLRAFCLSIAVWACATVGYVSYITSALYALDTYVQEDPVSPRRDCSGMSDATFASDPMMPWTCWTETSEHASRAEASALDVRPSGSAKRTPRPQAREKRM